MPGWWVHRLFAYKLGLDVELSRIVNEIIDLLIFYLISIKQHTVNLSFQKGLKKARLDKILP